ncbi:hypothetical protein Barba19A_gp123 [Rheinheimera phage vB_RspM_Barba19A]|jgi:hypothetical protein|uniref:Uncharacterized protein n=2 Tax=Barbavirus barba19A TaxID=2734091 RepID=A0A4P8N4Y5_9CAUD|nr:hypothetical protein HOV47_gp123 [Rheinheimera phage vB_RspM_Barba19A]QCQ61963.1 hypothetical protein Barba19A_gp123 [Rheinheimera phage vB_RspM_Barba19A]QCQ64713.1 hypothetical protein Barba31A_gp123 [Rheinheimera phage vB_RspM_Barba31A]
MAFQPTLRLTKGEELTFQEMDDNFKGLADAIGSSGAVFVTLEEFDANAGTGGNDTAAFLAARVDAATNSKTLLLLNKTYLIDPIDSNTPYVGSNYTIKGSGLSVLKNRTGGQAIGSVSVLPLTGSNIKLENFTVDGNISADPVDWATGYNAFTGARGVVLQDVDGFTIDRVEGRNVVFAGIAGYRVKNGIVALCKTNRTRGNFGDGFYFVGENILFMESKAYDHTRIGFVLETNAGLPTLTGQALFNNCHSEYGHDASALYGGAEGNYGFWYENFKHVTTINCTAKNQGRAIGGGFKSVPSIPTSAEPSMTEILYCNNTYINCVAEDCRYGFDMNSIDQEYRNLVKIQNCSALGVGIGLYVGQRPDYQSQNVVDVENFHVYLDEYNSAVRGIMQLGGHLTVDGLYVSFNDTFNQVEWDNELNGYSAIGAFSTSSGDSCKINNAHVFLNDDTEIPVNIKFRSAQTRENLALEVSNTWVKNVAMNCKSIRYYRCTIDGIGTEEGNDFLEYEDCTVLSSRPESRPVAAYQLQVKPVTFRNCDFTFADSSNYLYAFISTGRVSKEPAFLFDGCTFEKDYLDGSYAVRLNAETTLKNDNNDVFNYEFNNCKFVNTGAATANPIIFTDGSDVDHFTALGSGNFKSDTLSVNGNATLVPHFNPVVFGKAKPDDIAITASRNIISNDFNRSLVNSTASAYVATLTATANTTAPIGTEITLIKLGTGDISFTPTAPTTINGTTTFAVTTQYSSRTIRKVSATAWVTV